MIEGHLAVGADGSILALASGPAPAALASPDTGPVYEAIATYVLACDLHSVKQVYVGGKLKVEGLTLIGVDEPRLRSEIDTRTDRLRAAAAAANAIANAPKTATVPALPLATSRSTCAAGSAHDHTPIVAVK